MMKTITDDNFAQNCQRPPVDIILGGVSILDKQAAQGVLGSAISSVPKNGYVPDFGVVPLNDQYGFFRFPYGCNFQVHPITLGEPSKYTVTPSTAC
jgi:hypothetical protein